MQYDDLLVRTRSHLESGQLSPAALERLLARSATDEQRPDVGGVLVAIGIAGVYAGLALLVGVSFDGMSHTARMLVPFLFPAAAVGTAIALARTGRPRWEVDSAGLVGQFSLAAAFLVAGGVYDPADVPRFGFVCALAAIVEVLACHRAIGSVRLTGWGMSGALVAALSFGSAGATDVSLAVIFLAQAVAASVLAGMLISRESAYAVHAARTAALLFYAAALTGIDDWQQLTWWHAVLTVAVGVAFVTAGALRMDALIWVGALGGLLWLGAIAAVIGDSGGAALAVVVGGAGLAGLGLLVGMMRRASRAQRIPAS
jgi:hypothetical protein